MTGLKTRWAKGECVALNLSLILNDALFLVNESRLSKKKPCLNFDKIENLQFSQLNRIAV